MKAVSCAVLSCFMASLAMAESITVQEDKLSFTAVSHSGFEVQSITELSSHDDRFGGLSGLLMQDGVLLSVSDKGNLFHFDLEDLSKVDVFPLRSKKGKILKGKKKTDAESLAANPEGGFYVAFERKHRLVPYDDEGEVSGPALKLPKAISKLSKNSGFEASETLGDGTLVLLGEGRSGDDEAPLWVKPVKGKWQRRSVSLTGSFRPTGLTYVAGREQLILMERFYKPLVGVRIRLSKFDIKTGQRTEHLGELTSPLPIDNMEGITSYRNKAGEDVLLLISDDNFSPLQRTLLMKLILK